MVCQFQNTYLEPVMKQNEKMAIDLPGLKPPGNPLAKGVCHFPI